MHAVVTYDCACGQRAIVRLGPHQGSGLAVTSLRAVAAALGACYVEDAEQLFCCPSCGTLHLPLSGAAAAVPRPAALATFTAA